MEAHERSLRALLLARLERNPAVRIARTWEDGDGPDGWARVADDRPLPEI